VVKAPEIFLCHTHPQISALAQD